MHYIDMMDLGMWSVKIQSYQEYILHMKELNAAVGSRLVYN